MNKQNSALKKAMLVAMRRHLGIVSRACEEINIDRNTHYNWMKNDEEYAKEINSMDEDVIDFVEGELFNQIKDGNSTSTIFFLKYKGKKRGYTESNTSSEATQPTVINVFTAPPPTDEPTV
jgi:hypothetical protein